MLDSLHDSSRSLAPAGGLRRAVAAAWMAAFLLGGGALLAADKVEVRHDGVNLYAEPRAGSKILARANEGSAFVVLERAQGWYKVSAPGATVPMWLRMTDAQPVAPEAPSQAAPPAPSPARQAAPAPVQAPPPAKPAAPTQAPPAERKMEIKHQGIGCVVAEKYPKFEARLSPTDGVTRARVYFRAIATVPWYFVDMKLEGGVYSGVLPKPDKKLAAFDYYVEVQDRTSTTTRTPDYQPEVVLGACLSAAPSAASVATANPSVGSEKGAPAVPSGFSPAGVNTLQTP